MGDSLHTSCTPACAVWCNQCLVVEVQEGQRSLLVFINTKTATEELYVMGALRRVKLTALGALKVIIKREKIMALLSTFYLKKKKKERGGDKNHEISHSPSSSEPRSRLAQVLA